MVQTLGYQQWGRGGILDILSGQCLAPTETTD
jgi:hypothetical protein